MHQALQLLKKLTWPAELFSISSIEDGVRKLRGRQQKLEVIHIFITPLSPKVFPPKKEFFHITKVEALSKLDEWIYQNLVAEEEYRRYLERYRDRKDIVSPENIDEYILSKHYRPRAVRILSRKRKSFDKNDWTRKRFRYVYRRKSNLFLKDGTPFHFDFRNSLTSIFVRKRGQDREILAVGGSGSSGQRERYTLFTAVFYLLGKKQPIRNHLFIYDAFNRYRFAGLYRKPIVTWDLGSNYPLDRKLREEILKKGLYIDPVYGKIKKGDSR